MTNSATNAFETQEIEKHEKKTTTHLIIFNFLHSLKSPRLHFIYRHASKALVVLKKPCFTALSFYCRIVDKNLKKPSRNKAKIHYKSLTK